MDWLRYDKFHGSKYSAYFFNQLEYDLLQLLFHLLLLLLLLIFPINFLLHPKIIFLLHPKIIFLLKLSSFHLQKELFQRAESLRQQQEELLQRDCSSMVTEMNSKLCSKKKTKNDVYITSNNCKLQTHCIFRSSIHSLYNVSNEFTKINFHILEKFIPSKNIALSSLICYSLSSLLQYCYLSIVWKAFLQESKMFLELFSR